MSNEVSMLTINDLSQAKGNIRKLTDKLSNATYVMDNELDSGSIEKKTLEDYANVLRENLNYIDKICKHIR
jgi:hypothetical protein